MKGSVRKRGDKWYYYFEIGTVDGKRKKIERVGGDTKTEAQVALRMALNAFDSGFIEPNKLTVGEYLTDWLDNHIQEERKINTYNRYKGIIKNNLIPAIGHIKMKDLKPLHLDRLFKDLKKSELSGSSRQNIYGVLNSALNRAVKLMILNDNPCRFIDRPKRERFTANTLTIEEFQMLLDMLDMKKYNDYIFGVALQIVLELGLRRGELAGLDWKSVDFENNLIKIKNNLVYTNGKTYMETPKTEDSERTILFSDHMKKLLKKHRSIQLENKFFYGSNYSTNKYDGVVYDFILTWENGKNVHPLYFTQRFSRLLKLAGIDDRRIRFHDLRHTNATLLLSKGVNMKVIQERLGHSDMSITSNLYSHVTHDMQKESVDIMQKLISGTKK